MNSDTVACYSQSYPTGHPFNLPVAFTTTTSSETAFLLGNGNQAIIYLPTGIDPQTNKGAVLGAQTPFNPNANAAIAFGKGNAVGAWMGEDRPYFNSGSFSNRPFRLRAVGLISGGLTTLTLVSASINVYAIQTNVTTVTSGTKIANVTIAGGIGGQSANWMIECYMQWDSVSQTLYGYRSGFFGIGNSTNATAGVAITGVTSVTLTQLSFGLTWIFGTTSTSNTVGLTEISLEQV